MNSQPSVFRTHSRPASPALAPLFLAFVCATAAVTAAPAHARKQAKLPVWQWHASADAQVDSRMPLVHIGTTPATALANGFLPITDDDDSPTATDAGDAAATGATATNTGLNGTRIAQANPNQPATAPDRGNTPAAAPNENPPALTVPISPDKNPPETPATPPAETPPTTPPATPPVETTPVVTPPTGVEQPPLDEFEGKEVADVNVVGNRVVPEAAILGLVTIRRGAAFSPRQAAIDRVKVTGLGLFASVIVEVTPATDDPMKINVTFAVGENRVVTGIRFEGNKLVLNPDLMKVVQSAVGSVLNTNTVNADVERVQEAYRNKGFAVLVTRAQQLEDGTLVFTLAEGRIGRVTFQGNKKTSVNLLHKLVRTKTGDPFDQAKLRRDASTLYDTSLFEDVSIAPPADDPENPGAVLITFVLKEKRTGQLQLGLGFDTRSKLSGFVTVGENNFRHMGQTVSASVQAGSESAFSLAYGNPYVGSRLASYNVTAFSERFIREPRILEDVAGVNVKSNTTFYEQRTGGRLNYTLPLDENRYKSLLFGYRAEHAKFYLNDTNGNRQDIQDIIRAAGRPTGTVSAFSIGFLRDRRDSRQDASQGGREQIIFEQAIPVLGNVTFSKLDLDLRRYFTLIRSSSTTNSINNPAKLVFATRAVAGLSGGGSLPIFEQYFLGGSDTIRGYDVDEQLGNNQLYANFELRYHLQRSLQLVGFTDVGRAFGGSVSNNIANNGGILFSVGAGVRLQTPIGPIRIDVGRPLTGNRSGIKTEFAIGPTF